jgi:hypothetical protein
LEILKHLINQAGKPFQRCADRAGKLDWDENACRSRQVQERRTGQLKQAAHEKSLDFSSRVHYI